MTVATNDIVMNMVLPAKIFREMFDRIIWRCVEINGLEERGGPLNS
jgi:hypothetical protein